MKPILITLIFTIFCYNSFCQFAMKKMPAIRTDAVIKIDGTISEPAWKTAQVFEGFTDKRIHPGGKEQFESRTEMWMLYDDNAIYVAGYCHERLKDSVTRELVGRDGFGITDFAGIILDTYNDKLNGFEFFVTPYGEQYDGKVSSPDANQVIEDFSWNAVWSSSANVVADGWTFEIKIPYSALRFSGKPKQDWGVNLFRFRNKTQEQFSWNPYDVKKLGVMNQEGEWTGIENIKPPLRLSLSPYLSTYINHYPYKTTGVKDYTSAINGGVDLKYGINSSFTLDMTLVPDFGQVQSDNKVLNLTPFEVKYNENRPFFTEGTELFNKGDLFYSRRVGGVPLHHDGLVYNSNEQIVNNPTEAKLINATKISGRTSHGLGIGFFNAVTKAMYATLEDDQGKTRDVETAPLTNYNILVLNQSLKNHSALSFINTNVIRKGNDYNANVSALSYDYNDKKSKYTGVAKVSVSNLAFVKNQNVTGYSHNLSFGKSGGSFNYNYTQLLVDDKYDNNDLGILNNNNFLEHDFFLGQNWHTPTKWYNSISINNVISYTTRYNPSTYQSLNEEFTITSKFKNHMKLDFVSAYNFASNDFYEPRIPGKFFKAPSKFYAGFLLASNASKRFQQSIGFLYATSPLFGKKSFKLTYKNSYRFTDKFALSLSSVYRPTNNDAGFADVSSSDVIFSRRDIKTFENIIDGKYNFNRRSGITFRARHYQSKVQPLEYFTLQNDGSLLKNSSYSNNLDKNLNIFNVDMVYTLEFAPGNFINIVYKNSIFKGDKQVYNNYFKNLSNTITSPQNNNLSFKIIYYLDYLKLRKKK